MNNLTLNLGFLRFVAYGHLYGVTGMNNFHRNGAGRSAIFDIVHANLKINLIVKVIN